MTTPRRTRDASLSDFVESRGTVQETGWRAYSRVLYRHRRPALAVLGVALLAALAYIVTATPIFEAKSQLLIQVQTPEAIQFREAPDQEQLTNDDYQTQYGLLRSRGIARRTIDTLKLWEHPEFRGGSGRLGRLLGGDDPPPADAATETAQQTLTINRFLTHLSVEPVTNSRLVDVRFRSADPALAARVANTLAQVYIDHNVEGRFQQAKTTAEWLEAQLSQQRSRVEEGQRNLQRYRERNPGSGADRGTNIVTQKLVDLNAAVTRAETQRIEKQSAYERLKGIENDPAALDAFPAILGNTYIQALKTELAGLQRQQQELSQRLGAKHPDMLKLAPAIQSAEVRLKSEIGKVVQAIESDYLAARANEDRLRAELAVQQRASVAQDRRSVDLGVIEREVTTNQQLFDSLMQRAKELGIAGEFKTTNVRIVDQAEVPHAPVSPARAQALLMALLVGSMLAAGVAVTMERLDTRIKSPGEIPAQLGLPYLGLVPELAPELTATGTPLITKDAPTAFLSAFEDLSSGLIVKADAESPRVVLVCSSGPGEGKTLIASNLAVAIAGREQRVLLIDVDLHRPHVHEVFSTEKNPGLTDVLAAQAKLSTAVRKSAVPNLWVLTAGQAPERAGAFLGGGPLFRELLGVLAGQFDWIILDSPPVLAVADSTLIAKDATGVVFVVNTQKTTREAARVAIDRLDVAGGRFFGAVLNRANVEQHEYYFDPYYRKEYGSYYGRDANGPADEKVARPQPGAASGPLHAPRPVAARTGQSDAPRPSSRGGRRLRPADRRPQVSVRDN
jgi:capsular exopolysaccharide synthesis family protein